MEPHLQHTHGRHYDEHDSLAAGNLTGTHDQHNEDEHHGEKKSMIKKVKEKAKKLNNTITKHGHSHDQHDDDDDDDEEAVADPDVHGAPMYDSARVGLGGGPDAILAQPRGNLERPSLMAEDRYTEPPPGAYGQQVNPEKWSGKIGQPTGGMEEDPFAPRMPSPIINVTDPTYVGSHGQGHDVNQGELRGIIGKSTGMVADPHAPKDPSRLGSDPSNYETKVTNPTHTGGKEAELSQIKHSLDKMSLQDESRSSSSSYAEKISSSATDYAHMITDKVTGTLAPVYEKVANAGSSVISKVQGTVSGTETGTGQPQMHRGSESVMVEKETGADKGVSVKEYLVETLRPGDEDKASSGVITHAFHRGNQLGESEKKSGEDKPMGIVTESVEVRTRLGTDRREEQQKNTSNVKADKNVTERLSDAVGSWFGGKGDAPQGTLGTSYVTDQGLSSNPTGDQKNTESGRGR